MSRESQAKSLRIPASLSAYSDIKAFNIEDDFSVPLDPPMVYDKNIVLSQDEISLLSKGPKCAIRQNLDKETFKVELEKCVPLRLPKREKYVRRISLLSPKTEKYVHRLSLFLPKREKYIFVFMSLERRKETKSDHLSSHFHFHNDRRRSN